MSDNFSVISSASSCLFSIGPKLFSCLKAIRTFFETFELRPLMTLSSSGIFSAVYSVCYLRFEIFDFSLSSPFFSMRILGSFEIIEIGFDSLVCFEGD